MSHYSENCDCGLLDLNWKELIVSIVFLVSFAIHLIFYDVIYRFAPRLLPFVISKTERTEIRIIADDETPRKVRTHHDSNNNYRRWIPFLAVENEC